MKDKSYEFAHHPIVIIIKISLLLLSVTLFIFGEILWPSLDENQLKDVLDDRSDFDVFSDNWLRILGFLMVIAIIVQIIRTIKQNIVNRNDKLRLSPDKIFWSDNDQGEFEIDIEQINSIQEIHGEGSESNDIHALRLQMKNNEEEEMIDLLKMNLISQSKKIIELINISYPELYSK